MSSSAAGPLRWLGAIAVLGVLVAMIVPMAMDAVSTSIEFRTDDGGEPAPGETATEPAATDPGATASPAPADPATPAGTAGDGDATEAEAAGAGDATGTGEPAEEATGASAGTLPETYTVQSGDTGYSIAERLYDDRDMWPVIAEENGINASSALQVGQELTLPAPE